jgi:proteasome assembly chaperone (PAC2) family protein
MASQWIRWERRSVEPVETLVVAFSGWMDGGEAATGSVEYLRQKLEAAPVAQIEPMPFYIHNFPGDMDVSAMFRPTVRIENGVLQSFEETVNEFSVTADGRTALFSGKEPNLQWEEFADAMFEAAETLGVERIVTLGSVGGSLPHTREPRFFGGVSDESLKDVLKPHGVHFRDYTGPASFQSYLMARQMEEDATAMLTLVAETPAYVDGRNPKSIAAMTRKLGAVLGLELRLGGLRARSDAWEKRLNAAIAKKSKLAKHIAELEADYDNDLFETQMGDLKSWLKEKGIRVD